MLLWRIARLRIVGKFLGVVAFYPTWFVEVERHDGSLTARQPQLRTTPYIDLVAVLTNAAAHRRLVACLPWVCEMLAMLRDDTVRALAVLPPTPHPPPTSISSRWGVLFVSTVLAP